MDAAAQLPLALGHRVALGIEDFLVASSNREAVEWIDRWPDWPFTALIVVGPSSAGKTHLAQLWRVKAGAGVVDLATQDVDQSAVIAQEKKAALVDDADRAGGDPRAERALLHLYNLLRADGGHLMMTASTPPRDWGLQLPDLASRLNTAMVVTIGAPDDALLAAVALKLFADRQLTVGEGVIPLLLTRGQRSFAGLAQTVDAIDRAALAARRPVTVALVRTILEELA